MRAPLPVFVVAGALAVVVVAGVVSAIVIDDDGTGSSSPAASLAPAMPTAAAPTSPAPAAPSPAAAPAPTDAAAAPPPAVPAPPATAAPLAYVVQPGDTLSDIAAWFALHGYAGLYEANRATIGADPGLIRPGQRFTVVQGLMRTG